MATSFRDRTILKTLYLTGLRRQELSDLRVQSLSSLRTRENRGLGVPGSGINPFWWRWRESNPRPKPPPVGVYKLSPVYWFQNGSSRGQDDPSLASGRFIAPEGSARARYTR